MARVIGNNMARSLFDTFLKDTLTLHAQCKQAIPNPIQWMLTLFKVNKLIIPQFILHSFFVFVVLTFIKTRS
jgi:hypothetical protein